MITCCDELLPIVCLISAKRLRRNLATSAILWVNLLHHFPKTEHIVIIIHCLHCGFDGCIAIHVIGICGGASWCLVFVSFHIFVAFHNFCYRINDELAIGSHG